MWNSIKLWRINRLQIKISGLQSLYDHAIENTGLMSRDEFREIILKLAHVKETRLQLIGGLKEYGLLERKCEWLTLQYAELRKHADAFVNTDSDVLRVAAYTELAKLVNKGKK